MTALVVQPMKLGDLVQATPLLRELKSLPGPLILVATRPEVAAAAAIIGLTDQTVLINENEFIENSYGPESSLKLKALPDRIDLLVNLSSSAPALAFAQRFAPKTTLGPQAGPGGPLLPQPQRLAAAIMSVDRPLGRLNLVDLWRLLSPAGPKSSRRALWDPALAAAKAGPSDPKTPGGHGAPESPWPDLPPLPEGRPLIGLHLGSGNHLRRWPVERFVELALGLAQAYPEAGLLLLGGPGERSLARRFLALFPGAFQISPQIATQIATQILPLAAPRPTPGLSPLAPLDLSGQTPLKALGAILARLDLFVSADTGVAHIAAAVGAPTLTIFGGPALAGETAPYAPGALIVQGLAPCAPCAEIRPCPTRPCPALPPAQPALRAALSILSARFRQDRFPPDPSGPIPIADFLPAPGGQFRLYRAGQDSLGQTLIPAFPTRLTATERLALAVREASARALFPDGPTNPQLSSMDNHFLDPSEPPFPDPLPTIKAIASLAFDQPLTRKSFADSAMAALALIDRSTPKA
ncbi:MAG: glycosyltransferase family 9 protein [Deltaproteobacteria bacterium]|jgi:ADP-heptose:LPS heptosyltransferase|nr:glycosyltransferase family 9 protein [Deltaproteobacteria bacterium]